MTDNISKYADYITRQIHIEKNTWTSKDVDSSTTESRLLSDELDLLLESLPSKFTNGDHNAMHSFLDNHMHQLSKIHSDLTDKRDRLGDDIEDHNRVLDHHHSNYSSAINRRDNHVEGTSGWHRNDALADKHSKLYSGAQSRLNNHLAHHNNIGRVLKEVESRQGKQQKSSAKPKSSSMPPKQPKQQQSQSNSDTQSNQNPAPTSTKPPRVQKSNSNPKPQPSIAAKATGRVASKVARSFIKPA